MFDKHSALNSPALLCFCVQSLPVVIVCLIRQSWKTHPDIVDVLKEPIVASWLFLSAATMPVIEVGALFDLLLELRDVREVASQHCFQVSINKVECSHSSWLLLSVIVNIVVAKSMNFTNDVQSLKQSRGPLRSCQPWHKTVG